MDEFNDREIEILTMIAHGRTNQEIAEALYLSINTVRWYNKQIYSKLGVHKRTLAVARAREWGLIQDEDDRGLDLEQRVYFTQSFDGTTLAYALVGNGPPLVKSANYMCHLEYDWQSPIWRHWMEAFASEYTFIRYDERGSGLSDWDVEDVSFDAWVKDLEVVVDTLELDQFPLLGMSQGGPVSIAYAVKHPDKVTHLILYGAYARGWRNRDLTEQEKREERLILDLIRVGWGKDNPGFRHAFSAYYMPDGSPEQWAAFDELHRRSATPENAARLRETMHSIDVQELCKQVQVPTLVIHCRDDAGVPFVEGRLLASLIPNAQFVSLEGKNHIITENEPAWQGFLQAVDRFLSE
ncbi:MAG: alpha/beta fold hydrolase [Chloroflexi bacterium]|nr:alpha/beta fold hydrolase [Chloroflexota bacterium]